MNVRAHLLFLVTFLCSVSALAAEYSAAANAGPPRYTFSWPLDGSTLEPRGGRRVVGYGAFAVHETKHAA